VVERFARDIARCERSARHVLAIQAVRDSIQAETVFWYPGNSDNRVEIAGARELPADWCLALARKLIDGTPGLDGRLLRSVLPSGASAAPFHPRSAALVRVNRSKASWMVALNFKDQRSFQAGDLRVMALVRRILVNERRTTDLIGRMTETLTSLIQCLTTSIDAHLPHARGHSTRVASLAVALGKHMKLPPSVLNDLYFASLIHDIGITSVPQSLLFKPEKLTEDEFAQVKSHPVTGDSILAGIKPLAHLRPAVRHHHERFDGCGYPDGLAGDEIPLMARILGFADAFDAMRSPRPHRPPLTRSQVEEAVVQGAGKQWDPHVVEQYLCGRPHFHALYESGAGSAEQPNRQYVLPDGHSESSDLGH
jgi:hypothetical protein